MKSLLLSLLLATLIFFTISCHKSAGAICRDGHRSYSTGRGTCSWHGGVDHYIDTSEIDYFKTTCLCLFVGFVGVNLIKGRKK